MLTKKVILSKKVIRSWIIIEIKKYNLDNIMSQCLFVNIIIRTEIANKISFEQAFCVWSNTLLISSIRLLIEIYLKFQNDCVKIKNWFVSTKSSGILYIQDASYIFSKKRQTIKRLHKGKKLNIIIYIFLWLSS